MLFLKFRVSWRSSHIFCILECNCRFVGGTHWASRINIWTWSLHFVAAFGWTPPPHWINMLQKTWNYIGIHIHRLVMQAASRHDAHGGMHGRLRCSSIKRDDLYKMPSRWELLTKFKKQIEVTRPQIPLSDPQLANAGTGKTAILLGRWSGPPSAAIALSSIISLASHGGKINWRYWAKSKKMLKPEIRIYISMNIILKTFNYALIFSIWCESCGQESGKRSLRTQRVCMMLDKYR